MELKLELTQVPTFVENPNLITELVDRIFGNAANTALQRIAAILARDVPRDTGELGQSFLPDPALDNGGIELIGHFSNEEMTGRVFTELPYGAVMDEGRRPGAPINRAGLEAIAEWAQRKLGLSAQDADRAKWAIANAIIRRGLPAHHFMEAAVAEAQGGIDAIFAQAADDLVKALSAPGTGA